MNTNIILDEEAEEQLINEGIKLSSGQRSKLKNAFEEIKTDPYNKPHSMLPIVISTDYRLFIDLGENKYVAICYDVIDNFEDDLVIVKTILFSDVKIVEID